MIEKNSFKSSEPFVSVIVPVYNISDGLLEKCILSILNQTYRNLEIILVDDASNSGNKKIMEQYAAENDNVRIETHQKNRGLFQARITGVKASSADYVTFVDADDYITVDWIRLLVLKSMEEKSDITMGQFISVDEKDLKTVYNITGSYCKNRKSLAGSEILDSLAEDEGLYFGLHTVWDKLYAMKLWEKALPFLEKYDKHFVMTEDIAFSFVLFYYAEKMAFSPHDGYFYYRNSESSTVSAGQNNLNKIKKNITDIIYSFEIIKDLLVQNGLWNKYLNNVKGWKDRYFRFWSENVKKNTLEKNNKEQSELKRTFLEYFDKKDFEDCHEEDSFCISESTQWNSRLEDLKKLISSDEIKVVSFDIFDTLILRPLLYPDDIFEIMQWERPLSIKRHFHTIRALAEKQARRESSMGNPNIQDVTLSEIYGVMEKAFGVPHDECSILYDAEKKLEIDLAYVRKIGKELYELAAYMGKDIILISDMYLEKETVERILRDNGYTKHKSLYLSSDCRKLKATGRLFDAALKAEKDLSPENILHIGDNWESDYNVPRSRNMKACFLPKTKDILFNTLGDRYTGNSVGYAVDNRNSVIDLTVHLKKLPVRCLYEIAANEMFDDPFCPFKTDSDYNCDPYFMGAFPVGMHMFGIAVWMLEHSEKKGYKKIHFTSRDGFYLKKIYDMLREKCYPDAPESNYVHVSRKSMIPFEIENDSDILGIIDSISWSKQSPMSILDTYRSVIKPLDEAALSEYKSQGVSMWDNFSSVEECIFFLKLMKSISYSPEKAEESRRLCSLYFKSKIDPKDAIFDLGYSGKLQVAVIKALGFPVDGYYVHNNGFESMRRAEEENFNIYTFYDFAPSMSGIINEFIFSDYHPSCIGYKDNGSGGAVPVFDKPAPLAAEKYILDEISRGALNYASAAADFLREHKSVLYFQSLDTGLQYEKLLMSDKYSDRAFFRCCRLEDQYFGDKNEINMLNLWDWQLSDRRVHDVLPSVSVYNGSSDIYQDGVFMNFYNKVNRWFPKGSRKRERMKKVASVFFHKKKS